MGLTKIDFKILDFACLNGLQMHEAEVANRLRLKASTVSYSLKKMRREKAMLGFRHRVNYARLGLTTTAWLLLKTKPSSTSSEAIFDALLAFPQVHVVSYLTGEFDFAAKVIERGVFFIDEFVRKVYREFSESIQDIKVLVVTKNYKTHNIPAKESSCLPSLDETDFRIIDIKMRFPDKELHEIADELGLHRNTVSKRWKRLWEENVLVKKTPVVNPLHYRVMKTAFKSMVLIDCSPEQCSSIAKKLLEMKEVHELNLLLDSFSLLAIVRTADIPGFLVFLKWLLNKASPPGGVRKTITMVIPESKPHQPNYLPQLLDSGIVKFRHGKLACQATG